MAQRMARHVQHACCRAAKLDCVAFLQLHIDAGDLLRLARGAVDGAAGGFLDLHVPAGMIGVPVRVEDMADMPTHPLSLGQVFVGVRRVDGGGLA